MYWSIYDTLMLISGVIALALVVVPIPEIPIKTRLLSGAIGIAVIIAAIVIGNMASFRYPWIVVVAPVIALFLVGAVIREALKSRATAESDSRLTRQTAANGKAEHGQGIALPVAVGPASDGPPPPPPPAPLPNPPPPPPASLPNPSSRSVVGDPVIAPFTAAQAMDPTTPASTLRQIADTTPELWYELAVNPASDPALLETLASKPDPQLVRLINARRRTP